MSKETSEEELKDPSEGFVCLKGEVHNEGEWDNFSPSFNSLDYFLEQEIEPKGVTVEINKNPNVTGRRLKINVSKRIGFTDKEMKRHQSACVILEVILNSAEFKKRVLAKKYTTTKKTPEQIYDAIMTGQETLQPGHDYEFDVEVEMYYEKNNVVGYTYPNVKWTRLNRYVTADYDEAGIAGNLVHEWLHKAAFGHSSSSDHSSVPYSIGYLARDMVREYQKGARWPDLYPEVVVTPPVVVEAPRPVPPPPEQVPGGPAIAQPTPPITSAPPVVVAVPPIKIPVPTKEPKRVCHRPWYYLWMKEICYYE